MIIVTRVGETTASALDLAQSSLAPRLFWQYYARALLIRAQGFRRGKEPGAESKAEAVVSKKGIIRAKYNNNCCGRTHLQLQLKQVANKVILNILDNTYYSIACLLSNCTSARVPDLNMWIGLSVPIPGCMGFPNQVLSSKEIDLCNIIFIQIFSCHWSYSADRFLKCFLVKTLLPKM